MFLREESAGLRGSQCTKETQDQNNLLRDSLKELDKGIHDVKDELLVLELQFDIDEYL